MASFSALDIMKIAPKTNMEAEFDAMMIPHWSCYLSPLDVENLRRIATSKRYSGNMNLKYQMIDNIMKYRGFARFAGGTNRLVYKYMEDTRFLAKVAVDKVGMRDNPAEFYNQHLLKPYCTKMFHVTPCGTVGFVERVLPITSIQEFKLVADCIFDILYYKVIGKYIIEDIGTDFFMNYGIRTSWGPVLLDYPYLFELDGAKIQCKNLLMDGSICGGEIDYDDGFNNLVCLKCGRKYGASELRKDARNNSFIINKGGNVPMNVKITKGGEVIVHNNSTSTIQKPTRSPRVIGDESFNATIIKGGVPVVEVSNGVLYDPADDVDEDAEGPVATIVKDDMVESVTKFDLGTNDEPEEEVEEETEEETEEVPEENFSQLPAEEAEEENVNQDTETIPIHNNRRIIGNRDNGGRRVIGNFISEDTGDY